jgi:hypothetical protein
MKKNIFRILTLLVPFIINGQVNVGFIEATPITGTNNLNIRINSYCGNVHYLDNYEYSNNSNDFNVNVCYLNTPLLMPTNINSDLILLNANNSGFQNITINTYYKFGFEPINTCSNLINIYNLSFEGPLTQSRIFTLNNTIFETKKVSLYPNPNTGTFSVDLPTNVSKAMLSIYDMAGKKILEVNEYSSGENIQLHHLAKGLYLVKVDSDETSETLKFVVK